MNSNSIRCPYIGLKPYTEAESEFFFGREKETRLIIANLYAARLTILYGASGVGKSSVLRAGVIHNLKERDDVVTFLYNDWQIEPISGLKDTIKKTFKKLSGQEIELPNSASLVDFLSHFADKINKKLILILDQFEDYFLYNPLQEFPGSFSIQFPMALNVSNLPLNVLVSLREDALARLDRFEGSIPNLFDNYLRIEHLDRNGANEAIKKPLEYYNKHYAEPGKEIDIDQETVDEVIRQVKTGEVLLGDFGRGKLQIETESEIRVETPYLQLVMTRLWEEETATGSRNFRLGTLERLGGAESIVRTHLDGVINKLSSNEQYLCSTVFRYLVTPSGAKIAYDVLDLAEIAKVESEKLMPLLDKLSGSDFRVLRPLESPRGMQESAAEFSAAFGRTHAHQARFARLRTKRYEIFHDVLAAAILDWRARYLQAQEKAKEVQQFEKERRKAIRLRWVWSIAAFALGVFVTFLSYRYNWLGARSLYLSLKTNQMDVISWLVEEKVGENIVLDNISAEGTKRALVALRFAQELFPNNSKTKKYLDDFLRDSRRLTRPKNAQLELLQNNMMILREINKEVPYKPIENEIDSLNTRVIDMINQKTADDSLKSLGEFVLDSTVSDTTIFKGYLFLANNYKYYIDTTFVKNQILNLHDAITLFKKLIVLQNSDTATISRKLTSWQKFVQNQRPSPEKSQGRQYLQQLGDIIKQYATIANEEDFVTCRSVVNLVPQGITNVFTPGVICAWARFKSPRNEKVTFKWYSENSVFYTSSFSVPPSSSYRVHASKSFGGETSGMKEVRVYNSQNHLIGRRVFTIK